MTQTLCEEATFYNQIKKNTFSYKFTAILVSKPLNPDLIFLPSQRLLGSHLPKRERNTRNRFRSGQGRFCVEMESNSKCTVGVWKSEPNIQPEHRKKVLLNG